jgi:hypothetical protein
MLLNAAMLRFCIAETNTETRANKTKRDMTENRDVTTKGQMKQVTQRITLSRIDAEKSHLFSSGKISRELGFANWKKSSIKYSRNLL